MRRKSHVRFLGGDGAAMRCPYPPDIGIEVLLFSERSYSSQRQRSNLWSQVQEGEFAPSIGEFVAARHL